MSGGLKITLKGGERIYINGAVLRADRKVGIELLNDATFLLEQHIMQAEAATTPLRQLYFMVQMMLIDPSLHAKARSMADETLAGMQSVITNEIITSGLAEVSRFLIADRALDALKKIRGLYPVEAEYLAPEAVMAAPEKVVA